MKTTSSVTTESKGGKSRRVGGQQKLGSSKEEKKKTNKKDPEGNYTGVHINQKEGKEKKTTAGRPADAYTQQQKNAVETDTTTGRWAFSFSLYSTTHPPTRKRERKKTITIISHVFTLYAVSARPRNSSEL